MVQTHSNLEVVNRQVLYRDGTGVYPAVIHEGGVGGTVRLIVFGMRKKQKNAKGEDVEVDVPATVINDVPYGSRLSGESTRKHLFPYWDDA